MRKLGLYNHKGGVGKTTGVINIAYFFQKSGKKVLAVDCDNQKNCFSFFMAGTNSTPILATKYENIFHTTWERYQTAENMEFDFVIFDLPPAMTDEVKAIIRHCDAVFVPTVLGEFEVSGLADVTAEIQNQGTKLGGVFTTMYNVKNDSGVLAEFEKLLKSRLMKTVIPYSPTVRESQKMGLPIEAYFDEKNVPNTRNARKIALAYADLANEIIERSV
jgi:chromosome partitioning protein